MRSHPRLLVVGAPYNADGSSGSARAGRAPLRRPSSSAASAFPCSMVDERWSSLEASAALKARRASGERRRRVRREDIDSAAAAVILERWLAGESGESWK